MTPLRLFARLPALLAVAAALLACTPTTPQPPGSQLPPESTSPGASEGDSPAPTTPPPLAWGPTAADVQAAIDQAARLSDAELAGTVIVARYEGTSPQVPAELVADLHLGGVILFGPNVESLPQVQHLAAAVQEAGSDLGRDWPTIIAVDNEGGMVQRLSGRTGPWTTFPPFARAGEADPGTVQAAMAAMARELRASGVNTNYAPVADVTAAGDAAIGARSPSPDPGRAGEAVAAAVRGFTDGGVLPSVKHFPGHGGLTIDSHHALPTQSASTNELARRDLPPFQAGIEAGAPMVMMGHIDVEAWEAGVPASVSAAAYDYLREELSFTGVAITDGLDMGALEGTSAEIAVAAIQAGADILLTPADTRAAHAGLVQALADGQLSRDRLEQAAGRVIAMMRHQSQLAKRSGPVSDEDVGAARQAAAALAGE